MTRARQIQNNIEKLMEKYNLNEEEAKKYYNEHFDEIILMEELEEAIANDEVVEGETFTAEELEKLCEDFTPFTNYKVVFGESSYDNIPMIEIIIRDSIIDEEIIKGYLTPFRGYKFQVSGNDKGVCDMGSSNVILFSKEFRHMEIQVVRELLRGQAIIAIEKFINGGYVHRAIPANFYEIERPNYCEPFVYGIDSEGFNKFLEMSAKWVMQIKW